MNPIILGAAMAALIIYLTNENDSINNVEDLKDVDSVAEPSGESKTKRKRGRPRKELSLGTQSKENPPVADSDDSGDGRGKPDNSQDQAS